MWYAAVGQAGQDSGLAEHGRVAVCALMQRRPAKDELAAGAAEPDQDILGPPGQNSDIRHRTRFDALSVHPPRQRFEIHQLTDVGLRRHRSSTPAVISAFSSSSSSTA